MNQASVRSFFIKNNKGVKRLFKKGWWYKCAHCGKWCCRPEKGQPATTIPDYMKMEVDHVIPWSKGGDDTMRNLQALCKPCNRAKSDNMTLQDKIKGTFNTLTHPTDIIGNASRKAYRNNKVLKAFGVNKRR